MRRRGFRPTVNVCLRFVFSFILTASLVTLAAPLVSSAQESNGSLVRCVDCAQVEDWIKAAAIEQMEREVDQRNQWPDSWDNQDDDSWDDWGDEGDDWSDGDDDWNDTSDDDWMDEDVNVSCCGCGGSHADAADGGGGGCGGGDSTKSYHGDDDGGDLFGDSGDDDAGDDAGDDDTSGGWTDDDYAGDDDAGDDDSAGNDDDDDNYSETNTQEEGVDEADLVKTDGEYLYLVSGGYFLIYEASPAWLLYELSRTDMVGRPEEMYVRGDIAVIFTVLSPESLPDGIWPLIPRIFLDRTITKISIVSIADREHPKPIRDLYIEGPMVASRRIDGIVHAVFGGEKLGPDLPMEVSPFGFSSESDYREAVEALKRQNRTRIEAADMDRWLPRIYEVIKDQPTWQVVTDFLTPCERHYRPGELMGASVLSVLSIDMDTAAYERSSLSVIATGLVAYATKERLYVAGGIDGARNLWSDDQSLLPEFSDIHLFDIATEPGKAIYTATGTVRGFVLNQFSMGDVGGDLRVATTYGTSVTDAANGVYVLRQSGASLDIIGSVEGIAPGEELYAARFIGKRGYLVTYPTPPEDQDPDQPPEETQDPLFTVDISDPSAPAVVGELVVPGFSTYIHPMDENHLITVGEGGDQWGADGGVALSIFDVSNLADPQRVWFLDLGDMEVSSDAQFDHHAFLFDGTDHLLAIPLEIKWGVQYSGVYVFHASPDDGFEFLADVDHSALQGEEDIDNYTGVSHPRRSVILGEDLITVSDLGLVVTDMESWQDVNTVDLPWKDRTSEGL